MSWLIWSDTVCPQAFEFSIRYSSDKTVFEVSKRFLQSNRPGYPHPVSSELENSGIRVVSERQSVIAVSLNIGGGVHLIKPANCSCARKTLQNKDDRRTAPGVCGNDSILLSHSGNVIMRIGIHTIPVHTILKFCRCQFSCLLFGLLQMKIYTV